MSTDVHVAARAAGYELLGEPRRGGSGVVWQARDRSGDLVAIKMLAPGFDDERLRREAAALSHVSHPSLVRVRGVEMLGDAVALVTDWVEGESLRSWIDARPGLVEARATAMLTAMADAVSAMHDAGIVHRDLTSANVLVTANDVPVIIDLGLARTEGDQTMTIDGTIAGTPRYLAPEVIGGATAGRAADVYALGVLATEITTGSWPYDEHDSFAAALQHHLHSAPTPVQERRPELSTTLDRSIEWALQKVPDDRPSAAAFGAALEGQLTPPRLDNAAVDLAGRHLPNRWLALVGALAVVGGVVAFLVGADDEPEPGGTVETTAIETTSASTSTTTTVVPETVPTDDGTLRLEVSPWEAGFAEQLACNLLVEADFETEFLPNNYWFDAANPTRERTVADRGRDGSAALEIGDPGVFGLFGEIVDIEPGTPYLFSVHARVEGEIITSELSVEWLDADFAPHSSAPALNLLEYGEGQLTLSTPPAPVGAEYAVPRIYKDNSPGLLFVDELVFAEADSDCRDLLVAER